MHKILLVDDDEDILWINQMILTDAGFSCDIFTNPQEALLKFYSEDYGVAVLDYMMPKMNGRELATKLLGINQNLKIIFLTGFSEFAKSVNKSGEQFCVLVKPISGDQLVEAVKSNLLQSSHSNSLNHKARVNDEIQALM